MVQKCFSIKMFLYCVFALTISNCKVPYGPTLKSSDTNSLVVEGVIDGAFPFVIKLSRSRMLTNGDTAARKPELGAKVIVEDDHQNSFPLYETGMGTYSSLSTLSLNTAYQYRLHIFTANKEEYLSALVPFKSAPAIDSIGWNIKDGGVQVYVNTHDPNNSTRYYRWEYKETWEFHTEYYSNYKYISSDSTVIPRTDQINICWRSDSSTNIFLSSSANLSSDVIYQMPLPYIQPHDQKLSVLYSIWVKQFALDLNGYNYWLAMKNNTENVGSIFDPQPNETVGNIHCVTNPAENVVGYISAGSTYVKRVFISNQSLPLGWNLFTPCTLIVVPNIKDSLAFYFGGGYDPIDVSGPPAFPPVAYSASDKSCVDCTLQGTNLKPSFWP